MAATINRMIPAKLGWDSRYPRRDSPELKMTKAATTKSKPPTARAANFSASPESDLEQNRQRTTIAENNLIALSPPNPRRAELRAIQAAASATMASTVIQAIVSTCRRTTRRSKSGAAGAAAMAISSRILILRVDSAGGRFVPVGYEIVDRHQLRPRPVGQGCGARKHLAIRTLKLQAQLKRDQARRVVASQTDAEQAGLR